MLVCCITYWGSTGMTRLTMWVIFQPLKMPPFWIFASSCLRFFGLLSCLRAVDWISFWYTISDRCVMFYVNVCFDIFDTCSIIKFNGPFGKACFRVASVISWCWYLIVDGDFVLTPFCFCLRFSWSPFFDKLEVSVQGLTINAIKFRD